MMQSSNEKRAELQKKREQLIREQTIKEVKLEMFSGSELEKAQQKKAEFFRLVFGIQTRNQVLKKSLQTSQLKQELKQKYQ